MIEDIIEKGLIPFHVTIVAGSTSSTAVDPILPTVNVLDDIKRELENRNINYNQNKANTTDAASAVDTVCSLTANNQSNANIVTSEEAVDYLNGNNIILPDNIWFRVDCAYGLCYAVIKKHFEWILKGVERVDSVNVNGHK